MKQITSRVFSVKEVMDGVFMLWLKTPLIAAKAKPGQFVMLQCGKDNLLRRPLSIHNINENKTNLAVLFAVIGKGTKWLSQRKPGESIDILGPLGNGYNLSPESREILLVGGGIGIAPLPFLAKIASENKCSTTMLAGVKSTACADIENNLPHNTNLIYTSENGLIGVKGLVTILIPNYFEKADQVFACGPAPMYRSMAKMPQLKDKPVQVSLETRMGCGFGACYGCTIKTKQGLKQVCKDGPVFEMNDVLWDELADL